jgi:hypothetical protein
VLSDFGNGDKQKVASSINLAELISSILLFGLTELSYNSHSHLDLILELNKTLLERLSIRILCQNC